MRIKAPAKVNLALHVLARGADGYHRLETVFQAISIYDRLELTAGRGALELSCRPRELQTANNLVLRAARLLQRAGGVKDGCRIRLTKGIPVAAGLGGGSSDAAATLVGLNKLWRLRLSREELMVLGGRLGSDVPFFITGRTALATGRGDVIEALPALARRQLVVVKPSFGLSTAAVYRALDLTLTSKKGTAKLLALKIKESPRCHLDGLLYNDLESGAFALRPELIELKAELTAAGGEQVMMSGSGSACFAVCRDADAARRVAGRVRRAGRQVWLAHTL